MVEDGGCRSLAYQEKVNLEVVGLRRRKKVHARHITIGRSPEAVALEKPRTMALRPCRIHTGGIWRSYRPDVKPKREWQRALGLKCVG